MIQAASRAAISFSSSSPGSRSSHSVSMVACLHAGNTASVHMARLWGGAQLPAAFWLRRRRRLNFRCSLFCSSHMKCLSSRGILQGSSTQQKTHSLTTTIHGPRRSTQSTRLCFSRRPSTTRLRSNCNPSSPRYTSHYQVH